MRADGETGPKKQSAGLNLSFFLVFPALLIAMAVWGFSLAGANAPALNSAKREIGVNGTWRPASSIAAYDLAEYYYQTGYGYAFSNSATEMTPPASSEAARARFEVALGYFEKSLRLAPANGYAWSGLAWASALTGDRAQSARALEKSVDLAPFSRGLAVERAFLARLLTDGDDAGLSDKARCADMMFMETQFRGPRYRFREALASLAQRCGLPEA